MRAESCVLRGVCSGAPWRRQGYVCQCASCPSCELGAGFKIRPGLQQPKYEAAVHLRARVSWLSAVGGAGCAALIRRAAPRYPTASLPGYPVGPLRQLRSARARRTSAKDESIASRRNGARSVGVSAGDGAGGAARRGRCAACRRPRPVPANTASYSGAAVLEERRRGGARTGWERAEAGHPRGRSRPAGYIAGAVDQGRLVGRHPGRRHQRDHVPLPPGAAGRCRLGDAALLPARARHADRPAGRSHAVADPARSRPADVPWQMPEPAPGPASPNQASCPRRALRGWRR